MATCKYSKVLLPTRRQSKLVFSFLFLSLFLSGCTDPVNMQITGVKATIRCKSYSRYEYSTISKDIIGINYTHNSLINYVTLPTGELWEIEGECLIYNH